MHIALSIKSKSGNKLSVKVLLSFPSFIFVHRLRSCLRVGDGDLDLHAGLDADGCDLLHDL